MPQFVRTIGILNVVKKFFVDFAKMSTIPVLVLSKSRRRSVLVLSCDVGDVVKVQQRMLVSSAGVRTRCTPLDRSATAPYPQSRSNVGEHRLTVISSEQMLG